MVRKLLLVKGERKGEMLSVMFDSGSSRSLINSNIAKELSTPGDLPIQVEVVVANGHRVHCKQYCNLIVEIGGKGVLIQPLLINNLPVPLIFGALDMEAYAIKLDFVKRELDLSEFRGYMLAL